MTVALKKKYLIPLLVGLIFLSLILFNTSFRMTVTRTRAIHETQKELTNVSRDVDRLKSDLTNLENNATSHEHLVRRDLGYIRPGEKEIRFVAPPKKETP